MKNKLHYSPQFKEGGKILLFNLVSLDIQFFFKTSFLLTNKRNSAPTTILQTEGNNLTAVQSLKF